MTIFGIILKNIRSKYTPTLTKLQHFKKILGASVKSCNVCTFIAFKKKYNTEGLLFQLLKDSLQFIKITLHWLQQFF